MKQLIEQTRQRMYDCAAKYGFVHEETVKVSQELDELLNRLQESATNAESTKEANTY